MKYLFHSPYQLAALQRASARNTEETGIAPIQALRAAITDESLLVAFTAAVDSDGLYAQPPKIMARTSFEDTTYLGNCSDEERILVSDDGITPSGRHFARNRGIEETAEAILECAINTQPTASTAILRGAPPAFIRTFD
ncbi:MAG: hypothetical protein IT559_05400 [Alphaproteobacteria bacterium]|nr:hypothetical protein [Alphaproteobacteria bacterium]